MDEIWTFCIDYLYEKIFLENRIYRHINIALEYA